jgi:peptidoglycan/xylan/chitin deacetylase (PgdA/CDA1 family)
MKTNRLYTMKRALILNYHQLIETDRPLSDARFSVAYSGFVAQMKLIQQLAIPVISLDEWVQGEALSDFSVMITFDDGFDSDHSLAFPLLKKLGFPATFFPFTDGLCTENRVTWEKLNEMNTHGFTIASHGVSHTDLRTLPSSRMNSELCESKELIEKKIGKPAHFFALPFGGSSRAIADAAITAGYSRILSTQRRINFADGSIQLHRWNIKADTSLSEFEKMLRLDQAFITRKKITSRLNQLQSSARIYLKNKLTSNRN